MKQKYCVGLAVILFLFAYSAAGGNATCLNPPSGMIGWWTGDNSILDEIGSNHAVLQNGAGFAPGKVDQAFSFDGIDDWVWIDLNVTSSLPALTVDLWVKHDSLPPDTYHQYITGYGLDADNLDVAEEENLMLPV